MGELLVAGVPYEALRHHTPEQVASIVDGMNRAREEQLEAAKQAAKRAGGM